MWIWFYLIDFLFEFDLIFTTSTRVYKANILDNIYHTNKFLSTIIHEI